MKKENVFDIANWIQKNIESCDDVSQMKSCRKLIDNFRKQYPEYNDLCVILEGLEITKYFTFYEN